MPRTLLSIAAVLQKSPDIRIESRSGFHSLVKASSEVEEVALGAGMCECIFCFLLPSCFRPCLSSASGSRSGRRKENTPGHPEHAGTREASGIPDNKCACSIIRYARALYQGCAGYLSRILHVRWCGVRKTTKNTHRHSRHYENSYVFPVTSRHGPAWACESEYYYVPRRTSTQPLMRFVTSQFRTV